MTFEERLQKAIERGHRRGEARAQAEAAKALSEQELRRLHSHLRLQLTEKIEECLREVVDRLPGFRYEAIVNEEGWGAAISRDDVNIRGPRQRNTLFSRLELLIRPISEAHVLDLAVKATVRNKELFRRDQYQRLEEADLTSFEEVVDLWVLEFAEAYAAGA